MVMRMAANSFPAIIGTAREDGVSFANYGPYSDAGNFSRELSELYDLQHYFCPATETTRTRQLSGLDTYVFQASGNFSNLSPKPWMGAYHGAELALLFGTHPNYRGDSTGLEWQTRFAMEEAWVAFASDPKTGLKRQNWSKYDSLGGLPAIEFGAGVPAQDIGVAEKEALCNGRDPVMAGGESHMHGGEMRYATIKSAEDNSH